MLTSPSDDLGALPPPDSETLALQVHGRRVENVQGWKSNCGAKVSNFVVLNCLSELNEVWFVCCQEPLVPTSAAARLYPKKVVFPSTAAFYHPAQFLVLF